MPLETMIAAACLAGFVGLVMFAAFSDIATMEIPNWVSIAAALLFPFAAWLAGMNGMQIGVHIGVGLALFVLGFALFSVGVLGGGDVKVIAAVGVWTGLAALSSFALAMAIAGGALAFIIIVARRTARRDEKTPAFLNRLLDPQNGVPYAVAIAIGMIASLPAQPVVRALAG
jgi:prepilin peptidase CpaA